MDSETAKLLDSLTFDHIIDLLRRLDILMDFCHDKKLVDDYRDALLRIDELVNEARRYNRILEYVQKLTQPPIKHGKGHTHWSIVEQTRHEKSGLASKAERTLSGDKWPNCRAPHLKAKES